MQESTVEIRAIFPTPIYSYKMNRSFNSSELKFLEKSKKHFFKNEGNTTTIDNYILNKKPFSKLKKELELRVNDYFDKVICPSNKIVPYITQSWLNFTKTKEYHHKHSHPNSIISGVLYMDCDEQYDKIRFHRDYIPRVLEIEKKEYNYWNSDTWWFSVKTGELLLFPSTLTHDVQTKEGSNTRTSLAFNVFIKGTLGSNRQLTELKL